MFPTQGGILMHMKKIIAAIFALTLMLSAATAFAADNVDMRSMLAVDGHGEGFVTPDMATITIGVTTLGQDASKAQNDNALQSGRTRDAIRALGIAESDIQTSNYSFQPNYETGERSRNKISGYVVNNSIVVTVRNTKLVGRVIDTALASGANEISSLDFSARDTEAVRKEALLAAVSDARQKADILAQGVGRRIIGIKSVSENTGTLESRRLNSSMLMLAKDAATPIEAGSLSLSANVHIEYILSE